MQARPAKATSKLEISALLWRCGRILLLGAGLEIACLMLLVGRVRFAFYPDATVLLLRITPHHELNIAWLADLHLYLQIWLHDLRGSGAIPLVSLVVPLTALWVLIGLVIFAWGLAVRALVTWKQRQPPA